MKKNKLTYPFLKDLILTETCRRKVFIRKPDGIKQLNKKLAFYEMFKEAQDEGAFYAAQDDFECVVGPNFRHERS